MSGAVVRVGLTHRHRNSAYLNPSHRPMSVSRPVADSDSNAEIVA
jgi:hypothetical protein